MTAHEETRAGCEKFTLHKQQINSEQGKFSVPLSLKQNYTAGRRFLFYIFIMSVCAQE